MEVVGAHGERLVLSKASENNQVHLLYSLSLSPFFRSVISVSVLFHYN